MKRTPRLRKSLGAKIKRKRSRFIIWYYNIPHSQIWEQAHLLTQNRTAVSRQRLGLSSHPALTAAKLGCTLGQGHFCPYLTQKGNKEQHCDYDSLAAPLFLHSSQDS